jgi:hypothetical protein
MSGPPGSLIMLDLELAEGARLLGPPEPGALELEAPEPVAPESVVPETDAPEPRPEERVPVVLLRIVVHDALPSRHFLLAASQTPVSRQPTIPTDMINVLNNIPRLPQCGDTFEYMNNIST